MDRLTWQWPLSGNVPSGFPDQRRPPRRFFAPLFGSRGWAGGWLKIPPAHSFSSSSDSSLAVPSALKTNIPLRPPLALSSAPKLPTKRMCNKLFTKLPLCAVISKTFLCMHGGLPRPEGWDFLMDDDFQARTRDFNSPRYMEETDCGSVLRLSADLKHIHFVTLKPKPGEKLSREE
ncbi:hypothetical protein niasHS_002866 [Heterodera schachtii]|uniref:Uncharacterized protein n=1 Tax=Heterodera schachtii TaxID=97005 RepID=A0ABD2K332_HETSC